jgi:hypothetical protein
MVVWITGGQSWITDYPRGESYHELWKAKRRSGYDRSLITHRAQP